MKEFIITSTEYHFLIKHLADLKLDTKVKSSSEKQGHVTLLLPEKDQNHLVNGLTSLLVIIGLDENDEPNDNGLLIEKLIDVFNPYKN